MPASSAETCCCLIWPCWPHNIRVRTHGHSLAVLQAMNPGRRRLAETLRQLADNQLVREIGPDTWALTDAGLRAVAVINPEAAR